MKALFLCTLSITIGITGLAQNIEIPEATIIGQDRGIYKTPIFFQPYNFQIIFPQVSRPPQKFLK